MKTKGFLTFIFLILLTSCAPAGQCTSDRDKHIVGQRHKYTYNYSKCPKGGFVLPMVMDNQKDLV